MKNNNENAVSPVIGVLLMVAITVILAAIIAVFVFNMAGTIQKGHIVGITMSQIDGETVTLTNMGGQDVGSLVSINVTGDLDLTKTIKDLGIGVGATGEYTLDENAGQKHIIAVGIFTDGTEQVLLDAYAVRT